MLHDAPISLNRPLTSVEDLPEILSRNRDSRTNCKEALEPDIVSGAAARTVAIYFGELVFAVAVAIALLAASSLRSSIAAILFCCGLMAWTLAEYVTHRFVLHAIAPVQHGIHHARPNDAIDKIFWQIWLAFVVLYLTAGGAILAGVLVAYAWYLLAHYCAHHYPAILPVSLLKHHRDHHRFANRNYGVTTTLWDRCFGTMLL
jgi:sterol desaturase/sphingolipid hydroxylase (fatty acid hydroxylase superfamily)